MTSSVSALEQGQRRQDESTDPDQKPPRTRRTAPMTANTAREKDSGKRFERGEWTRRGQRGGTATDRPWHNVSEHETRETGKLSARAGKWQIGDEATDGTCGTRMRRGSEKSVGNDRHHRRGTTTDPE